MVTALEIAHQVGTTGDDARGAVARDEHTQCFLYACWIEILSRVVHISHPIHVQYRVDRGVCASRSGPRPRSSHLDCWSHAPAKAQARLAQCMGGKTGALRTGLQILVKAS